MSGTIKPFALEVLDKKLSIDSDSSQWLILFQLLSFVFKITSGVVDLGVIVKLLKSPQPPSLPLQLWVGLSVAYLSCDCTFVERLETWTWTITLHCTINYPPTALTIIIPNEKTDMSEMEMLCINWMSISSMSTTAMVLIHAEVMNLMYPYQSMSVGDDVQRSMIKFDTSQQVLNRQFKI